MNLPHSISLRLLLNGLKWTFWKEPCARLWAGEGIMPYYGIFSFSRNSGNLRFISSQEFSNGPYPK
jgi:hypothetical protein